MENLTIMISLVTIVEQRMLYELREAENSLNDLHNDVLETLNRQNRFEKCTHDVMVDNNFIRAAAIAFVPNYFKAQGYWYEVYTMRVGDSLETDLIGGVEHDYTAMAWYNDGLTTTRRHGVWSMPYIDFDDSSYIMSVRQRAPLPPQRGRRGDISSQWLPPHF